MRGSPPLAFSFAPPTPPYKQGTPSFGIRNLKDVGIAYSMLCLTTLESSLQKRLRKQVRFVLPQEYIDRTHTSRRALVLFENEYLPNLSLICHNSFMY